MTPPPDSSSASSSRPRATRAFKDRLAVVFDFDRTLAGSSYGALLEACGYDADAFREEHVEPLSEAGWDDILAQFYTLIRETRKRDDLTVTEDFLHRLGRDLELHDGVAEMFDRIRGWWRSGRSRRRSSSTS